MSATCKTCPHFYRDGGACRLTPPTPGRSADDPAALPTVDGEEDYCGQHPERLPMVCLKCGGDGYLFEDQRTRCYCPICHGVGKVAPTP